MWSDASHVTVQGAVKRQNAPAVALSFADYVAPCLFTLRTSARLSLLLILLD
jgi:hypothetical protein